MTLTVTVAMPMPTATTSPSITAATASAPTTTAVTAAIATAATATASAPTATTTSPAVPASTSRWIRISRRIGCVESESDYHTVRSGWRSPSDDQLSAGRRTQSDRDRCPAIGIGDRGIRIQLPIGHPGIEPKYDARSRHQAPTGVGRLDYQWRSQGTADRAALLVTRDRAQLGRQLISGKGDVTAAGGEEQGNDKRESAAKRTRSKTRSRHTSPG